MKLINNEIEEYGEVWFSPDAPTVEVHRVPKIPADEYSDFVLEFKCPTCGATNSHQGHRGSIGCADGHRNAHCRCYPSTGYNLKEVID